MVHGHEARPLDDVQRHARRAWWPSRLPARLSIASGAAIIGAVAGVLCVLSVFFWDRVGVDDVVGAISVHGVNGLWGVISLGLFANGKYGAGWNGVVRDDHGDQVRHRTVSAACSTAILRNSGRNCSMPAW